MQKIVLYIKNNDGVYERVDMFNDETISLTSKIQDVRDISKVFTDFSQTFTLPASRTNNKLFQHWYNASIDNGFDARNKKDAVMELDFSPFRRGKIALNNVKLKDNKPFSYEVVFYGNIINLKDLLGDDELNTLPQLDNYTHNYNDSNVKTGLQTGLSSGKIIYPLISHTKRFYYDSAQSTPNYNGNLHFNTTQNSIGLGFDDLKPAIKCMSIIEAIEDKYDISFTRDFFNENAGSAFKGLFLWLSRNKGPIGGDENQESELTRICGDWVWNNTGNSVGFQVFEDTWTVRTQDNDERYQGRITVTPTSGSTTVPYKIKAVDYITGNVISETTLAAGTRIFTIQIEPSFLRVDYKIKFIIESSTAISFSPVLELTKYVLNPQTEEVLSTQSAEFDIDGTGSSISTVVEIIITQNVPKIKNIDFLTGLFKMFNLTAYYINDVADPDFGKIYVDTLDNFYADRVDNPSEGSYDITKYIDTSNSTIERAFEYDEIDFMYEEPSTLVSINHKEKFNEVFGEEYVRPTFVEMGSKYEVKAPFEHMKFERLIDDNRTGSSPYQGVTLPVSFLTDILWGYSADGDFESKTDVTPNIGNYSPVLTKPLVFYAVQETGIGTGKGIKWLSSGTPVELTQYYRPSNTIEDGTNVSNPSDSGTTTSASTNKLIETGQNFTSTVRVGDVVFNLANGDVAVVVSVDSDTQLTLSEDIMSSGHTYRITSPPAFTINFDDEIDEWNLTNYYGTTNSLFKKFYTNYVTGIFKEKRRIYKLKAFLPTEILVNYRLNDEFIIQDKVYTINSIVTNLRTEVSQLELLNKLES